jgi:hypothetical protein
MINKKQMILTGVGVATIGMLGTAAITKANWEGHFGVGLDKTSKDKLNKAVEDKDYATWKQIQDSRKSITDYIDNEEKFKKFVDMQNLIKDGKFVAADKIRQELGLPERVNKKGYSPAQMETIHNAIQDKDYEAWKKVLKSDDPILEKINSKDKFDKYVEMMKAIKSGDTSKAKELAQELELPRHMRGMKGGMMELGIGRGMRQDN